MFTDFKRFVICMEIVSYVVGNGLMEELNGDLQACVSPAVLTDGNVPADGDNGPTLNGWLSEAYGDEFVGFMGEDGYINECLDLLKELEVLVEHDGRVFASHEAWTNVARAPRN